MIFFYSAEAKQIQRWLPGKASCATMVDNARHGILSASNRKYRCTISTMPQLWQGLYIQFVR